MVKTFGAPRECGQLPLLPPPPLSVALLNCTDFKMLTNIKIIDLAVLFTRFLLPDTLIFFRLE